MCTFKKNMDFFCIVLFKKGFYLYLSFGLGSEAS